MEIMCLRRFVALMLIPLVLTLGLPISLAVVPVPNPRVCTEYFRSDFVFSGKIIAQFDVVDTADFIVETIFQFELTDVYKGSYLSDSQPVSESMSAEQVARFMGVSGPIHIQVRTPNDTSRAIVELGESYLVFASSIDFGDYKVAYIFGGGNTGLLEESQEAIEELHQIQQNLGLAKTGNVRGWIYDYPQRNVEGIRFKASSDGKDYFAHADAGGWFEFDLPPGNYKISADPDVKGLVEFGMSYDDPSNVAIRAGECAEIAFGFRAS